MIIQTGCTPKSNDERMAEWAYRFFSAGYHRDPPQLVPEVTYSESELYSLHEHLAEGIE